MQTTDSRRISPQLIVLCAVAAIGGVCCLVLPPYLTQGGLKQPAYGWPLIPWFAVAWANARMAASAFSFLVFGLALGIAQPRRWLLLRETVRVGPRLSLGHPRARQPCATWAHRPPKHVPQRAPGTPVRSARGCRHDHRRNRAHDACEAKRWWEACAAKLWWEACATW